MHNLKPVFYNSVGKIPQKDWNSLACSHNLYYTPEFLQAFETANKDIEFNYIVIYKNDEAVAFANTQVVTINIETITKNIKLSEGFKRNINRLFCNNSIRVLFCGNIFLSGEYGTFLKKGEEKVETFNAISKAVKQLAKQTKRLNALFVKDFENESLYITDNLKNHDFTAMQVEPNMMIYLKPEWQNFDDYKAALKSKYRVKANKADSKSANLKAQFFTTQDIEVHKNELQNLYENTIANANFNAQVLNLNTYTHLKETHPNKFFVKGYFLENKLVGFLTAMLNGNNLDAHFIGLDYSLNKELAIYPRILNDYVRLGIEHKAKKINLGRTASEIKSTLGAVPQDLTCYIRHKRSLPNQIMKPFIKNVTIKSFKQHQPFK